MFITYFNSYLLALCLCLIKFQSKLQLEGRKGSGSHPVRNWRRLPEQSLFGLPDKRFQELAGTTLLLMGRLGSASTVSSSILSTFQLPLNAVKYQIKSKSFTKLWEHHHLIHYFLIMQYYNYLFVGPVKYMVIIEMN